MEVHDEADDEAEAEADDEAEGEADDEAEAEREKRNKARREAVNAANAAKRAKREATVRGRTGGGEGNRGADTIRDARRCSSIARGSSSA